MVVSKCRAAQTTDVHCSLPNLCMWQDPENKWVEKYNDPNMKGGTQRLFSLASIWKEDNLVEYDTLDIKILRKTKM